MIKGHTKKARKLTKEVIDSPDKLISGIKENMDLVLKIGKKLNIDLKETPKNRERVERRVEDCAKEDDGPGVESEMKKLKILVVVLIVLGAANLVASIIKSKNKRISELEKELKIVKESMLGQKELEMGMLLLEDKVRIPEILVKKSSVLKLPNLNPKIILKKLPLSGNTASYCSKLKKGKLVIAEYKQGLALLNKNRDKIAELKIHKSKKNHLLYNR